MVVHGAAKVVGTDENGKVILSDPEGGKWWLGMARVPFEVGDTLKGYFTGGRFFVAECNLSK